MMDLHPLRAWHIAGLFARKLQARFFADSQHLANGVNRLNARGVSVLIEKGVTRHLDRISQANCTVRIMFFGYPALEEVIAVTHTATAAVFGTCEIFCAPQTGERRDELECRSWRQAADRTINQWIGLIFLQCCPILRFDAGDESVWVE